MRRLDLAKLTFSLAQNMRSMISRGSSFSRYEAWDLGFTFCCFFNMILWMRRSLLAFLLPGADLGGRGGSPLRRRRLPRMLMGVSSMGV